MMITDDAIDVHFGLRLFDRAADHTYCHNYTSVNRPGNCGTCGVGQVIRAMPSKAVWPWNMVKATESCINMKSAMSRTYHQATLYTYKPSGSLHRLTFLHASQKQQWPQKIHHVLNICTGM